jgi:putative MATE family efflux protein
MARWVRRIESHEMGTGRVLPTLIALGVPAAAAGLTQTLFEMVDFIFIGQLGKEQVSGVALVGPLFFFSYAIASAIQVGTSALVSRRLGQRRPDQARDVVNHALLSASVIGVGLTVGMLAFLEPILMFMGKEESVLIPARQFTHIALLGLCTMHLGVAADGALRAQGNTIAPMKISIVANIVNAILNPLLIYGLHMGVRGSALGTLITRTLMTAALLAQLWAPHSEVRPGRIPGLPLFLRWSVIRDIYWIGIPVSVGTLSMAAAGLFTNKLLMSLNPFSVGVMGVAMRLEGFAFTPVFGLFSAVVPMVGYNLGACQYERCKKVIWAAAGMASVLMGAVGALVLAFPAFFFGLFNSDPQMLPLGVQYLRINMPVYPLVGGSIMMSAGFQGLGKSWIAMLMHLYRNLVLRLPFAYWFAAIWGLLGVFWSFPTSTLLSAGISIVWMYFVLRSLGVHPEEEAAVPLPVCNAVAEAESDLSSS